MPSLRASETKRRIPLSNENAFDGFDFWKKEKNPIRKVYHVSSKIAAYEGEMHFFAVVGRARVSGPDEKNALARSKAGFADYLTFDPGNTGVSGMRKIGLSS